MADFYRDCWIFNDQVYTVERTTETGMHVRGWGDGHLVWRGHHDDLPYLDGRVLTPRKVKGNWPIYIDSRRGMVLVQHDDERVHAYDMQGGYLQPMPAPYASEGIHHRDKDYRIVMGNDPSLLRVMPNGETWHQCVETENFIVGQFGRDPDYGGSLSKLDKRTGHVTRWLGYTPHPPRAVELNGVLTVAISGRDTPAPDQVEWAAGFPPLPGQPPIVTPPSAPADCTAERERIAILNLRIHALTVALDTARAELAKVKAELDEAKWRIPAGRWWSDDQLLRLVNDATGQMAGYWRYLGVQGAVDRAVKAELARR
jgi:hypothetical protein